jgi:hypothetical protein
MSIAQPQSPDELSLANDLAIESFVIGTKLGQWRLIKLSWPMCSIAVAAAVRENAPSEVLLNFDLTGYPSRAPTSTPWDIETNVPLAIDLRPAGRRASSIFRRDGWNNGVGLYAPYDRLAMSGHDNWQRDFPHLWWKAEYDIAFYLQQVYDVLHDADYTGV